MKKAFTMGLNSLRRAWLGQGGLNGPNQLKLPMFLFIRLGHSSSTLDVGLRQPATLLCHDSWQKCGKHTYTSIFNFYV